MIQLQNKLDGSVIDVEENSPEFAMRVRETSPDGKSKWEQIPVHKAVALMDRARAGTLRAEDLGKAQDPGTFSSHDPRAILHDVPNSWRDLTPGEVEAGLTADAKEDHLLAHCAGMAVEEFRRVFRGAEKAITGSPSRLTELGADESDVNSGSDTPPDTSAADAKAKADAAKAKADAAKSQGGN
jgi:hypothetical protein